MDLNMLYVAIRNAKVLLLGERHNYVGDTALVITLANKFLADGKRLTFYMEHFPGETTKAELDRAMSMPVVEGDWRAVDGFLNTRIQIAGKAQSPAEAWEHPEQQMKLRTVLRFAQLKGIPVKGHDLDFSKQEANNNAPEEQRRYTVYKSDKNKPPKLWEKQVLTHTKFDYSKHRRDTRMSLHCLSFARTSKAHDVLFAFIGAAHLAAQLQQIGIQIGDQVRGIRISDALLDTRTPATPNAIQFVQLGPLFEARPAG